MRYVVRLLVVALASYVLAASGPAAAAPVGVFASTGEFGSPVSVVLRMDMRRGRLRSVVLAGDARCNTGGGTRFSETLVAGRDLRMRRNGDGRFVGVAEAVWAQGDGSVRLVYRVSGRLEGSRRAASGRLSASAAWFDESGNHTKSCRRRAVRWSAIRDPGALFAGATSQDEPVVVWRPTGASWVTVGFRWHTQPCSDGVSRTPGSGLRYILVRWGFMWDSTTVWEPLDDGGDAFLQTRLSGSLGNARGRGWYRAVLTLVHPDGSAITCKSGRVWWRVQTG